VDLDCGAGFDKGLGLGLYCCKVPGSFKFYFYLFN
jgi:hypothetical protein